MANESSVVPTFALDQLVQSITDSIPIMPLERIARKQIMFLNHGEDFEPFSGWGSHDSDLEPCSFSPKQSERMVSAIDSSTIHIGETPDGSVFAAKAAVAFSARGRTAGYYRLGPFIFYVDEEDLKKIADDCASRIRLYKLLLVDNSVVQKIIRTRIERSLLMEMASALNGSFLIVDGSLGSSAFESRGTKICDIIRRAHAADNCVHGVSKTTNVRILRRLADSLRFARPPAYLDVDDIVKATLRTVYGRILLVRFSVQSIPLRVDVSSPDDFETSIAQVAYSEAFYHGYHESLRLAHYLSVFSFDELTSIKGYLVKHLSAIETTGSSRREFVLDA